MNLQGKLAVVTGAGRGLGRQTAINLAAHGAPVAAVSRNAEELSETVRMIEQAGGVAWSIPTDISQPEAVERLREQIDRRCGAVSILVNAAGVFGPIQLIKESDPHRWIQTLGVNVIGPYLTCRA